ncbi:hypothetical protein FB192DRAFT_1339119 [Mucor lusitanicus]|nr:hypothetical protein FB192DRAFT_1339119 [Mucor lusitanicus]
MQALIQENQSLRSSLDQTKHQLEQAHQQIQELESQKASPVPAPVTPPSFGELAKKPADPSTSKKPKSKAPPRKKFQPLNLDINDAGLAAARHFSAVLNTHGYRFVYIPTRGRSAISTKRADLHAMGIQNKRVLDIHFPDRHILRDPKYLDWEPTACKEECRRLYVARAKVIIARMKDPNLQLAVARFFTFKEALIPETDFATMATTIKPAYIPAYKRQPPSTATQDDDMDAEATTNNNTTPLSTNNNARADETSAHKA